LQRVRGRALRIEIPQQRRAARLRCELSKVHGCGRLSAPPLMFVTATICMAGMIVVAARVIVAGPVLGRQRRTSAIASLQVHIRL
jgi:hypothetical protein